jgi:uncharacterized protein (TIGR00255 family)
MIKSMTGFAARDVKLAPWGRIHVELRSTNHKFLETVVHLPEGFLFLEESIKKIIESKVKRGRITCVVALIGERPSEFYINAPLMKSYMEKLSSIKKQYRINNGLTLDTLLHLPGVLSVAPKPIFMQSIWPQLKPVVIQTVETLARARQKEGLAMQAFLKKQARGLTAELQEIGSRFKKAIAHKLATMAGDEEKASFLKDTDITEEIDRLSFHIENFIKRLTYNGPIGKELDFITQEMQREANTAGAKTSDAAISIAVVRMKSQIEKMREQLQNIE